MPTGKMTSGGRPTRDAALLALLLLGALLLSLRGITFGLPAMNDPDEPMFEMGALRMLATHSLNPGWFGHPATTTMECLALVNLVVFGAGRAMGWFGSPDEFVQAVYHAPGLLIVPGRVLMALFGLSTVALVWRLGATLFGRPAGLAAAAMLAVDPIHIKYAQTVRSDMMACFFMLLCLTAAVRIHRTGRWRDHVWASLWLGLAVATKWPFALSGVALAAACALRLRDHPDERRVTIARFAACLSLAPVWLLLVSPYLLIDHATVLRDVLGEAKNRHLGATGGTPLENAWWYLRGPLLAGLGTAGLGWLVCGAVLGVRRAGAGSGNAAASAAPARSRAFGSAAVVAAPLPAFACVLCVQHLVWERWALPLLPLASILAGAGLIAACRWLRAQLPPSIAPLAIGIVSCVTLLPPALASGALARERTNDTRQQASRWAAAHVAPGSTVLVEQFAFDLLRYPWKLLFPLGEAGCIDARASLAGGITYAPIASLRGDRAIVDYGTLPPARRGTCAADYAIVSQYDRYRAERAAFPREYSAYRALVAQGREVAVFAPRQGVSGGPVVRILDLRSYRPPRAVAGVLKPLRPGSA